MADSKNKRRKAPAKKDIVVARDGSWRNTKTGAFGGYATKPQ